MISFWHSRPQRYAVDGVKTARGRKRTIERVSETTTEKTIPAEPAAQGRKATAGGKDVKFEKFDSVNSGLKIPIF